MLVLGITATVAALTVAGNTVKKALQEVETEENTI